jgi:hypothetical protein
MASDLETLETGHLVAALEVLELGGGESDVTITLDFTSIFAWIGGLVCLVLTLWGLGWLISTIRAMGEFLGIWDAMGRGIKNRISWVKMKFNNKEQS